jgi:hypothetical protein
MERLCRTGNNGCATHRGLTYFPVLKAGNNWVRGNVLQFQHAGACRPANDSFTVVRHPLERLMSAFGEAAWRAHVDLSCKNELCLEAFSAPKSSVEDALWRLLLNSSAPAPPHAFHLCPMAPTVSKASLLLRLERLQRDWELLRTDHAWLPPFNATRPFGHLSSADPAGYTARFAERSVGTRAQLCALLHADFAASGYENDCLRRRLTAPSARPWPHPRRNRYGDAPIDARAAPRAAPPPPRRWLFG